MDLLVQTQKGPQGALGLITLNRPHALNALTHPMIQAIRTAITQWDQDPQIIAIVIQACEGQAFCAGGDIKLASLKARTNPAEIHQFFAEEYAMNLEIASLKKPYIAFINGLCMGGGLGISVHGRYCLVTAKATLAMPETGIGFYPDIGASYFLQRCPGFIGRFIGLTGTILSASDARYSQLATHFINEDSWSTLLDQLSQIAPQDFYQRWPTLLEQASEHLPESKLAKQQELIDQHFKYDSIIEIIESLQNAEDKWCQQQANLLAERCPLSLWITLKAQLLPPVLKSCLAQELIITKHMITQENFHEGVRARLIDKDNQPHWHPPTLEEVDEVFVNTFFTP